MDKKYKITKLTDHDKWNKFESKSPQSSIFSSSESLLIFAENLDLYEISKGEETKCLIYLYQENNNVTSLPLIYSGILFQSQNNQKNSRYLAEKFKLTEMMVNNILNQYNSLDINLHYNVEDIRPFIWYNYHEKNLPKFNVDVRYTSIINLKNKSLGDLLKSFDDVKQRDIKKVLKNEDYKIDFNFDLETLKRLYLKTMKKNNPDFFDKNLENNMKFLYKINENGKAFQTNLIFQDKVIYCNLFSYHNKTACYLFGAGDTDVNERLGGTYSLWKSVEKCHEKKLDYIDLEGVNSPQRGSFKINFGGDLTSYYKLNLNK